MVIPVIIAVSVLGMWWTRNQANEKQFLESYRAASTAIAEAQDLPDEAAARLRLGSAREYLEKARGAEAQRRPLGRVQSKYIPERRSNQQVTPLYGTVPLWEFKGKEHKLDRVVVTAIDLFVLDRGAKAVDALYPVGTGRQCNAWLPRLW